MKKLLAQLAMVAALSLEGYQVGLAQAYTPQEIQTVKNKALAGEADAQYRLGLLYIASESILQDYTKAFEWFQEAAAQGHLRAQYNLGVLYKNGEGVRQNKFTAKEWFGKASDNGDKKGCDAYRELNETGF